MLNRSVQTLKEYTGPLLLALVIGALAGLGVVMFRWLILFGQEVLWPAGANFVEQVRHAGWWWKLLIPAGMGLLVGPIITFWAPEVRGPGVPEVMEALALRGGRIRHRVTLIKAFVTAGLISAGASVGQEGPVVQIGSSIGSSPYPDVKAEAGFKEARCCLWGSSRHSSYLSGPYGRNSVCSGGAAFRP